MAIEAQLADGRILEFPDGTDQAVIQSTVKRLIAESAPKKAAPAPAPQGGGFEQTNPAGDDFGSAIMAAAQQSQPEPKYRSVLERPEFQELPISEAEATRLSRRDYAEGTSKEAQRLAGIGKQKLEAQAAKRNQLRKGAEAEDYGFLDFAKDSGLDLAKGAVGLGEAYVGLLNLTSGGSAGRVLGRMGYDPEATNKFLNGFQSLTRKNARESVEEAQGFINTLGALAVNPTELLGSIVESLPGTVTSGAAAGQYVRFLAGRAAEDAAARGLSGAAAKEFIRDRVVQSTGKIAAAAGGAEGVQTTGSIAEKGRQAGRDWEDYVAPALAAGFGTAAISSLSGKAASKFGLGDVETAIAARSAGVKDVGLNKASFGKALFGDMVKEGFFEEMPQSAQEQIFSNLATGKPWDTNVDKAAAKGLASGMGMAGGMVAYNKAKQRAGEYITQRLNEYDEKRYQRPDDSGYYQALLEAKSKGFLAPERRNQMVAPEQTADGRVEPTFDEEKFTAPPTAPAPQADREEQLAALTAEIEATGIPTEDAQVQAQQMLAVREAEERKVLAPRIIELTREFVDNGMEPQQANQLAIQQATEEAQADAQAEREGAVNAQPAVSTADRTSAEMAGQPGGVAPTAGAGVTEPTGVVPAGQTTAGAVAGEGEQPGALTAEPQDWRSLKQVQRYEEPGVAKATTAKPHGVYTTPAGTESPHKDLGGEQHVWDVNPKANVLDVTSLAGPAVAMRQGAISAGAGVSAAKALLGDEAFSALKELDKKALIEEAKTRFPSVDFERYYDSQEVMEALGAQLAKQQGYDAIWQADRDRAWSEFVALTDNAFKEETAPKAKRGRPAVLTEEEKQQRAEDKRPVQAAKAKAERSLIRLTNKLDELATLPDEGNFETDEDYEAALADHRAERRETIKSLLQMQADPLLRGTKVGERVKVALARPDISEKEKADLKAGIEAQKRAQGDRPSSSRMTKGKADAAFDEFKNAAQAITHIIRTGNKTQKEIAKRLRSFVTNVKFVVVEKSDALPPQLARHDKSWRQSIGLFIENYNTGERAIYVRGASFGEDQGINNVTVLHELLHAATNRKIALAEDQAASGRGQDTQLAAVYRGLLDVMRKAQNELADQASSGNLATNIADLYETTGGEFIADPREFLAYGMTDEGFQDFLVTAEGLNEPRLISSFVRVIRRFFGFPPSEQNALTSLVLVTDALLSVRAPKNRARVGEQVSPTAKGEEPTEEAEEPEAVEAAVRTQKQLNRAVNVASAKFEASQSGEEYAKAVSLLQMMQDPRKVIPFLRELYQGMNRGARVALTYAMTTDFMAEMAADTVPELKNTDKLMQKMSGMTQTLLKAAGDLTNDISRAYRKDPTLRDKLDKITHMATLAEYDPADKSQTLRNKKLDQMYDDLGSEGQRVYNRIKKHFEVLSNYFTKLLDDQITQSGLPIAEQANLIKKIRAMYETGSKITPYFPLVRRGDYWLSIGSGANRQFFMFESMGERDRAMQGFADEKVKQKPGESNAAFQKRRAQNMQDLLESEDFVFGNDISSLRKTTVGNSELLTGVFGEIDKVGAGTEFSPEAKEQLKDAVYQIYLQTMPEQSFRKQFIHRKGFAGFRTDLLRNVADTTTKMATQLARIKYAPLLRNSLSQARDSIKNRPTYEPYVSAFERRVSDALSAGKPSMAESIAAWSNKFSFIYYLGGMSSAMLQPLSLFQTGIPVLTKYGTGNAYAEMGNMLKVWKEYGVMQKNADGTYSWVAPSIENVTRSADERRAIKDMLGRDITTSTYASDALDYKATPTDKISSPTVQFGKDTVSALVLGGLMHSTERLSREAMFLASYRLNRKAGRDHETAVDNAVIDTNEALGNYGQYNRPDFMKGAGGKVLTQFMMYPVHMTIFMGKNFVEMIKPMNGRTRWEASKKFFGTMGHTWVLGGAVGLWGFSTVMGFLGAMWNSLKDDEWPEDVRSMSYELWWRTVWLKEQLGGTQIAGYDLADIIERGPVNAITGADISSRTSLNNMWLRDTKETATPRESVIAMAVEKAGPTANMILSYVDAYGAFMEGDYKKGALKIAPAGFRNYINAYGYWKEGAKDNKGTEILSRDAFSTGDLIFQAVGFRSDLLANTQYVTFKVIGLEQKILNERNKVMNRLDRAYREKDFDTYTKSYKDMEEFNRKYPTYEITADNLVESLERREEQRATSFRGVTLTEKNVAPFAEALIPSRVAADKREEKNRQK